MFYYKYWILVLKGYTEFMIYMLEYFDILDWILNYESFLINKFLFYSYLILRVGSLRVF